MLLVGRQDGSLPEVAMGSWEAVVMFGSDLKMVMGWVWVDKLRFSPDKTEVLW